MASATLVYDPAAHGGRAQFDRELERRAGELWASLSGPPTVRIPYLVRSERALEPMLRMIATVHIVSPPEGQPRVRRVDYDREGVVLPENPEWRLR